MREGDETLGRRRRGELSEETGIQSVGLDFAAVVEFDLRSPSRREYAAVYRTELRVAPRLVVNDEVADFQWWDPCSLVHEGMNPLDAEIGRRVAAPVRRGQQVR